MKPNKQWKEKLGLDVKEIRQKIKDDDQTYRASLASTGLQRLARRKAMSTDALPDDACQVPSSVRNIACFPYATFLAKEIIPKLILWCRGKFIDEEHNQVRMMLLGKGAGDDVASTRPIAILSPLRKMIELLWMSRTSTKLWSGIGSYQMGFRRGGNTHIQIKRLTSRIHKKKVDALAYIDLKGAYNTVNRQALLEICHGRLNCDYSTERLQDLLKPMTTELNGFTFKADRGVPQGAVISPLLFNVYLD